MPEAVGNTIFILGDAQVGKTTIARRVYENEELILVSSKDGATEYQVKPQGRELPVRILEIRNHAFLSENAIKFNAEKDVAFFCYAVDDPGSFENVEDKWIPLFIENVCDTMTIILIGNKTDQRDNTEVMQSLAERGLEPVSSHQGTELLHVYDTIDVLVETSRNNFKALDEIVEIVNDTVLNYN